MSEEISELLKKALALPPAARAALAGSLLESLDETVDECAEAEWQKEIARRMQELDSGKVKPVAWAEARQQMSAILNGRYSLRSRYHSTADSLSIPKVFSIAKAFKAKGFASRADGGLRGSRIVIGFAKSAGPICPPLLQPRA